MKEKKLSKTQFMVLSFTWGIILTLTGFFVALAMLLTGHKAKRFGWCYYFEVGKNWGGCEFGLVFLRDKSSSDTLSIHEYGHAIQNAKYGPFMLILVNLPSSLRYWTRRIAEKLGFTPKRDYYTIWFEKEASELGRKYLNIIGEMK